MLTIALPITNIDLHGLQALFAADEKLIGYNVQEGQGPTQIAQDWVKSNKSQKCFIVKCSCGLE